MGEEKYRFERHSFFGRRKKEREGRSVNPRPLLLLTNHHEIITEDGNAFLTLENPCKGAFTRTRRAHKEKSPAVVRDAPRMDKNAASLNREKMRNQKVNMVPQDVKGNFRFSRFEKKGRFFEESVQKNHMRNMIRGYLTGKSLQLTFESNAIRLD